MFQTLSQFYNSTEWKNFRDGLIHERVNPSDGILHCHLCGEPILKNYDCIAHHIQPLTMQNVNDYSVSLNPENIQIVHARCHNEIHKRFGYCAERKVYFVYGAPCSGKTSFVKSIKGNSDLIVDMDSIWECITGGERYQKPNALKQNAFAIRDSLLDMVKTRAGRWEKAFVITGGARKADRDRQIQALGAEPIFIDTDKETCLERLASDEERQSVQDEWRRYIETWFEYFQAD